MKIGGIEWDSGNWPKCGKHGVSKAQIEHVLRTMVFRIPDPNPLEPRYRTAGQEPSGRHVFVVFTYRSKDGGTSIRPISARYMHGKEVREYEQVKKTMADFAER
ncbi:BrnT family toxin [Hoeflea sp.]|uniref:BrnT family toxin n=1 Tax=Hoeflea sp. TaxID=1940281 RepID=UPI0037479597